MAMCCGALVVSCCDVLLNNVNVDMDSFPFYKLRSLLFQLQESQAYDHILILFLQFTSISLCSLPSTGLDKLVCSDVLVFIALHRSSSAGYSSESCWSSEVLCRA